MEIEEEKTPTFSCFCLGSGHELPSYFMDCWTDYPVTNGWADPMG